MAKMQVPFDQAQKECIEYILRQLGKLKDESNVHKNNIRRHEEGIRFKGRIRTYQEYAEDAN